MKQAKQYSEAEILSGLKARDKGMLAHLYDQYGGALFSTAVRIVKEEIFAEEVIQDAFIKIWNQIERYDAQKGRLFTWMMRIVRNESIDKLRSAELRRSAKTNSIDRHVYTIDQASHTVTKIDDIGIKELLNHLKEEDRKILDLIYFMGHTHVQAAELLNLPLGTVKTNLRRAIKELRSILANR